MKIAVSAGQNHLDSTVDPRFGRCAFFLIVDSENMTFQAFPNENSALGGGAGIQSAQFIASKGAQLLITGNCGPNAMRTLSAAGIKVVIGQAGTAREAVERFKRGEVRPESEANVSAHYGSSGGGGIGGGFGMGRGGGRGRGAGMGRRMAGGFQSAGNAASLSGKEELNLLKDYAEGMKEEMAQLQQRIRELES
ncbi:MAG: dinitrogenase iron-molybdenum cofactor biosynthesis protein [Desulfobacteraceae bacterium]|nr:MAG: dinitrogenase iron-molybdenum cofactor biosynthesis protein [Desulfobacteraceae bacterium]